MILLIVGLALWSGLHFLPGIAPGGKTAVKERFGDRNYQIVFSIGIVVSIVLMVLGWRAMGPVELYRSPPWLNPVAFILVLLAMWLFALAHGKSNVKRYIRHPQLTGFALWAFGHVAVNGDARSVILFGGLGLWAIAEIFIINRRDGARVRPDLVPLKAELIPSLVGIAIFAVLTVLHPYIFGTSVLARWS